jgi:hypothetical protein
VVARRGARRRADRNRHPLTGAPGAVILYALIAVLAWPRRSTPGRGGLAAASPLGSRWSRAAWLALWGSFAYLILQPAVRAPRSLHDTLAQNAAGEPGWLAALDRGAASAAGSHGLAVSVLLAVVFAVIAAGILVPAATRPVLALAIVVGLAIWIVGENLGGMLTGMATDPNTGPLLILLAAAYWPPRPQPPHPDPEPPAPTAVPAGPTFTPGTVKNRADRGNIPRNSKTNSTIAVLSITFVMYSPKIEHPHGDVNNLRSSAEPRSQVTGRFDW